MSRTRQQVIDAASSLEGLLARTDAHSDEPLGDAYLDRRVADVLTHLHAWHLLFLGWVETIGTDATPAFPAEGYTWRDLTDLNEELYERYRAMGYAQARAALVASHDAVLAALADLDDELLTATDELEWLGDESLADTAHESLGGHYEWAHGVLDAAGIPTV